MTASTRYRDRTPLDTTCPHCGARLWRETVDREDEEWVCLKCGERRYLHAGHWLDPGREPGREYRGRHQ